MREIKFRAFIHPYCGGGIPQECYNTMDYSKNYELDDFFNLYKPHFFEVMQFTGLKDKNGKEIYEGDIVASRTLHEENWGNDFQNYEVGFYNGSFCFMLKNQPVRQWKDGSHDWYSIENTENFEIEIIGNIHENPELI